MGNVGSQNWLRDMTDNEPAAFFFSLPLFFLFLSERLVRIIRFLRDVTLCSRRELQPPFDGSLNLPATRMADPQE